MDVVRPWCNADTARKAFEELQNIFLDAIRMAQVLRRQRACWSIRFPVSGSGFLLFDSSSMRDSSRVDYDELQYQVNPKSQYVGLVISPALWKRGDEHGEHFEVDNVVSKAVVVLHRN